MNSKKRIPHCSADELMFSTQLDEKEIPVFSPTKGLIAEKNKHDNQTSFLELDGYDIKLNFL